MTAARSEVYVLWSDRMGQYKIGYGRTASRIKTLQTGVPDVRLVAAVRSDGAKAIETRLHNYFADVREGGEWFRPGPHLEGWVERFAAHHGTATTLDGIKRTLATSDMWPWFVYEAPLADETGQGLFDIGVTPVAHKRVTAPNGYAPASNHTDDWFTAPEVIELVRQLYGGTIDLDPLSCWEANLYVEADRIFTPESDGLLHDWVGRVLLNPPWGDSHSASVKERAIVKALGEYAAGRMTECCLIVNANATTTAWFKPLLEFAICFPSKRLKHISPGNEGDESSPNSGTVIVYMGLRVNEFHEIFSVLGQILVPYTYEEARV